MNGLRAWLNRNGAVVSAAAVLLIGLCLWLTLRPRDGAVPDAGPATVWFYDLNTKQLYPAEPGAIAPEPTPSGPYRMPDGSESPAGVRAYVFTCTDCGDAGSRFIGYLEMYTPAVRELLRERRAHRDDAAPPSTRLSDLDDPGHSARLIRTPDDDRWVPADSDAGQAILAGLHKRCGGDQKLRPCQPEP
jgi:hypothetical protein